jgi:hypothetical protein
MPRKLPVLVLTHDFARDQDCLNAHNRRAPRQREVPIAAITGSVGRTHLAAPARLNQWRETSRYRGIVRAMMQGKGLPPVSLYLLDGTYYILDGHHRVAAARQLGILDIDAEVTEFLPAPDAPAIDWHRARAAFERDTGLDGLHSRRLEGYELLRRQIAEHGWYLGERGQAPASFHEAAQRWYREVYAPVLAEMTWRGLLDRHPTETATELYLALCDHKWYRGQALTRDIGFDSAMREFGRAAWLVRAWGLLRSVRGHASALARQIGLGLNLSRMSLTI